MGGSQTKSTEPVDNPLSRVVSAIERSEYRTAITTTVALPRTDLGGDDLLPLMDAMLRAAAGLQDDSEDEVIAYNLVVGMGDSLPERASRDRKIQEKIESALFNKGVVLGHQGKSEEAIAVYDDLVRRFDDSRDPPSKENLAKALFNKGSRLAELSRPGEALAVYDELIKRFASAAEPRVVEALAKAMVNRGIALARLTRFDEAIADFDDVVILWGESPNPFFRERTALALLNKATALIKLGRPEGAMAAYEEIINRFAEDTAAEMLKQMSVARVLLESVRSGLS